LFRPGLPYWGFDAGRDHEIKEAEQQNDILSVITPGTLAEEIIFVSSASAAMLLASSKKHNFHS
jgi:hypothetical protein